MGSSVSSGGSKRGRRGRGGKFAQNAEINVTPMVDVMLVLLIVFMVAAPLLTAGVPVDLPTSNAKQIDAQDNKPIEVSMDKDGAIYIGETLVAPDKLVETLSAMMEGQEDTRIYIRGDQSLDYGRVIALLGQISGAGFSHVALISKAK